MLGRVIEVVTGQDNYHYIQANVTGPAGMDSTLGDLVRFVEQARRLITAGIELRSTIAMCRPHARTYQPSLGRHHEPPA